MSKGKNRSNRKTESPTEKPQGYFSEILRRFSHAQILVIGDFILDEFVWGSVNRISPEAPVPVVNVDRESFVPGGALNVANNIRTLSGNVIPCGVVGRDLHGRMLVKAMRREGIETRGVVYDDARPTTRKTRVIAHSQQVVRFDREKARDISKKQTQEMLQFAKKMMPEIDVVVIEDYGKGVVNPDLLKGLVASAKSNRKPIVVDPKEKHFSYYQGVSVITPNRKEAIEAFTFVRDGDEPNLDQVGHGLLRQLSVEAVLITLGEAGMALFEKSGNTTQIPTAAKQVYDVSGAGDTVVAVFALALASGANKQEAAALANVAAGIVVGKIGTATIAKREFEVAVARAPQLASKAAAVAIGVGHV